MCLPQPTRCPCRRDHGSATSEYGALITILIGGALAFGIAYRAWLVKAFGGDVRSESVPSISDVMGGWGRSAGSAVLPMLGLAVAGVVAMLVLRRVARRAGRRRGRALGYGTALAAAVTVAAGCVLLRYAAEAFLSADVWGAVTGIPTMSTISAVLLATAALLAGAIAARAVGAGSATECAALGLVVGVVVFGIGQLGMLTQGVTPEIRYIGMAGASVLLAVSGGIIGGSLAKNASFDGSAEGELR